MMIATTGCVGHTPDRFADSVQRLDIFERIGHGGSTYSSYILDGAVDCKFSVAKMANVAVPSASVMFTRLTPNKAGDCNAKNQRVIADERIGHGGSTYSTGETMTN